MQWKSSAVELINLIYPCKVSQSGLISQLATFEQQVRLDNWWDPLQPELFCDVLEINQITILMIKKKIPLCVHPK